jgi:amino acid transporter
MISEAVNGFDTGARAKIGSALAAESLRRLFLRPWPSPLDLMLRRSLTTFTLVFVMYFNISGGPQSTEGIVALVGPGMTLLVLLIIPLVWSLPETLIIGELASMLPVEGGYYRWVQRAFGDFWAFQNGWITWLYSLVDMAIYPVLFNQYLAYFVPGLTSFEQWTVSLAVIWGATGINLRGALPVGRASTAAGVFVIGAFVTLALVAIPRIDHVPWQPFRRGEGNVIPALAVALSTALWNYIGWDNASTVQGEIRDASRTYPRALGFALPLVTAGYFVALLPTLGATDWRTWSEGAWPNIALTAGGPLGRPLAAWVGLAGLVSAVALFNALLLVYSRIPLVMAQDGLLPARVARTDRRGTPRDAVLFAAGFYSIFALVSFGRLVVADVVLYALALALEFGALIALRRKEPELRGSFRIPLGRLGVIVLALVPAIVLIAVIAFGILDGDYGLPSLVATAIGIALGPVLYLFARRRRLRR